MAEWQLHVYSRKHYQYCRHPKKGQLWRDEALYFKTELALLKYNTQQFGHMAFGYTYALARSGWKIVHLNQSNHVGDVCIISNETEDKELETEHGKVVFIKNYGDVVVSKNIAFMVFWDGLFWRIWTKENGLIPILSEIHSNVIFRIL